MKYRRYRKTLERLTNANELERLLQYAQDDFENISDRQYELLRHHILKKFMDAK